MPNKKPVGRPKKVVAPKNSPKVGKAKDKPKGKPDESMPPILTKGRPWTDSEEKLLADLWQSEPHMFDWGEEDSTNQEVREATLQSFCEKLGRTGELIPVLLFHSRYIPLKCIGKHWHRTKVGMRLCSPTPYPIDLKTI